MRSTPAVLVALLVALLTVSAVLLSAGCDSTAGSSSTGTTLSPRGPEVRAVDNRFEPTSLTVPAGSTVTWTNVGSNNHNIVPVDGGGFGVATKDFLPGVAYSARFDTPGTYAYYCSIHGSATKGMTGTVVVTTP